MSKLITAGQQQGSNKIANKKLKTLLATTAMTAAGIMALSSPARAVDDFETPTGEQVVGGSASFDRPADGLLNVLQNTQRVVINWNSFNIGAKAKTEFFQPNSRSLAVNRVTGGNASPTMILGSLKANGRLMVLDSNGVFFGPGSKVDVAGIIASTGDVDTDLIMSGADRFEFTNFGSGSIVNEGTINVADAGLAAFVSPQVVNSGIINAKLGKVAFGAGSKVTLDLYGDQLLEIALDDKHADALIENTGAINAEGGTVMMTAQAAKEAVDNVINMGGVVDVSSVTQKGGKIVLNGGESGVVNVTGTMDASGNGGGDVSVTGQNIMVSDTANIAADGGQTGDGGNVTVIADNAAIFRGNISARGGSQSGNGGFVDTSGLGWISVFGNVDASAANGLAGLWLIDPRDLVVDTFSDDISGSGTSGSPWAPNGTDTGQSQINVTTITNALNLGTSVYLSTIGTPNVSGGGEGEIEINTTINKSAGTSATLSMNAASDIFFTGGSGINSSSGALHIVMTAAGDIDINRTITNNGGNMTLAAGGDINLSSSVNTSGGSVSFTAGDDISASAILSTVGGNVSFTAGSGSNDDIFLDHDVITGGGSATFVAGGTFYTDDTTPTGSPNNLDQVLTSGGNVNITVNQVVLGDSDDPDAGETVINAGAGTISIERFSSGDISMGANVGGTLNLSQKEIAAMTAANLTVGGSNTSEITVNGVNTTTATISNLVKLITGLNTGSGDDVNFEGTNVFNALEVDSDDDINFANNASVETKTGDAKFYGDTNDASVGNFVMGTNSKIDTNGHNVDIGVLDVVMNSGSLIGSEGGNVHITASDDFGGGLVTINGGVINAAGGNIDIDNEGVFFSQNANSLKTSGNGTIDVNQWEGGSIQNVHDAFSNTGTGFNTVHVGPGTFNENVLVYKNNVRLFGNNVGIDANTGVRVAESVIDGGIDIDGHAFAVKTTGDNFVIDGFTLTADGNGVDLDGTDGGISNQTVKNNIITTSNIVDSDDEGIEGVNVNNALISGNKLDVVGNDGMKFTGGSDIAIQDNTVTGTDFKGLNLSNIAGLTVFGNAINNTGDDGIEVNNSSGVNIFSNQIGLLGGADNIEGEGIDVNNSAGSIIFGNAVYNTTGNGISLNPSSASWILNNIIHFAGGDGIHTEGSGNLWIGGNSLFDIAGDGIKVIGGSNNYIGTGNIVQLTGGDGIEVQDSDYAYIDENFVSMTTDNGIYNNSSDGSVITSNAVSNTGGHGVKVNPSLGVSVTWNDISNAAVDGVNVIDSDNSSVAYNTITNSGNNGVDVVNSDNVRVWSNWIAGTGVSFDANGIFFTDSDNGDIWGNTVTDSYWDGIKIVNSDGTDATWNTVNDARLAGIALFNSDDNLLDHNTLNSSGGSGIHSDTNTNTTISSNDVNGTDAYYGIMHINGMNSSITGNTVDDSNWDGIIVWNQTGANLIQDNVVNNSGKGVNAVNGIAVGETHNAVVNSNDVDGSGWDGIQIANSNGVQVTNNTVTDTLGASGIAILSSNNAFVDDNDVTNSARLGIYLGITDGVTLSDNVVTNSGIGNIAGPFGMFTDGIYLEQAGNTLVDNNTVNGATGNGIRVGGGGNWAAAATTGNVVTNNYVDNAVLNGIEINDSNGVDVNDNHVGTLGLAGNIGGNGIEVNNSSNADILGNHIMNALGNGIFVDPSPFAVVQGNTINGVGLDGIHLLDSDNALIGGLGLGEGNTIDNAGDDGIEVSNSDNAQVKGNLLGTLSGFGGIGDDGVTVGNGSDAADVEGNTIVADGRGISVFGGNNHVLNGNTITTYSWIDGEDEGIYAQDTNEIRIRDNHVTTADNTGIRVSGGTDAEVDHNDIHAATEYGIDIQSVATALVTNNLVENTYLDGINAYNTSGLEITGNIVHDTGADGVHVANSNGAQVNSNFIGYTDAGVTAGGANNIGGDGIQIVDSHNVDVMGNFITNTVGNGVYIDPSDYVEVANNNIMNVGSNGIFVESGYWADIYSNVIGGAEGNGILVTGNGYVNVDDNDISYVDYDGIHVENFGYASITDNDIYHTGDDGIETVNGNGVFIDYNTVQNAGYGSGYYYGYADYYGADGIHVRNVGSYYGYYGDFVVEVTNNDVDVTADDGIEVVGSGRTLIGWNDVSNAGAGFSYYGGYYGWDNADGYGNDGIHVRNVHAYNDYGYYGEGYYGGYYSGYDVEILGNDVSVTADDGIEVIHSGSTLIQDNEVDHAGFVTRYEGYYGYYGDYEGGGYYGYYSYLEESHGGDYYGADGIHVRDVRGESYGPGYYGYYGFQPYAVVINDNNVDTSADDGIEVVDSGRTLINWNVVNNSGVGEGYYGYYGYGEAPDGWGGDGIHVRNTYAYDEYYYGGYDVEVSDNQVTNSADDGIEVTYNDYYGEGEYDLYSLDWFWGPTTNVGVLRNSVANSGDDGIDVTNANFVFVDNNNVSNSGFGDYNYDGDGITVNRHGSDGRRYKDGFYGDGWFPNDVVITNNTVDDSADDGIEVNGYGEIEIGHNIVSDSGDDGIIVTNLLFDSWYNEIPQQDEEVSLFLMPVFGGANVNIHDNTVDRSGADGIQVDSFFEMFFDYGFGPSNVNIENNDVTDSGENGLFIAGPSHGDVRVSGNTFTNFVNGAHFQSGRIDLTGDTNTFNNGSIGMLFAPYGFWYDESEEPSFFAPMDIVDDTIGTTVFNGQSDFYVYLDDSAEWAPGFPTVIDGTDATYDGIHPTETGNVLTLGQYNQIEAKIHDFLDESFRGLFFFGVVSGGIDQEDIFNQFDGFNPEGPGLNITITGLPSTSGTGLDITLAGIAPAAGGEEGEDDAEDLASIEPAAGGTEESCWADAVNEAQTGATVNFNYDGSVEALLEGNAECDNGEI